MEIMCIRFQGYNKENNQFSPCLLLLQKQWCTVDKIFSISTEGGYPICSDLNISQATREDCIEISAEGSDWYDLAAAGYSVFKTVPQQYKKKAVHFNVPRFSEIDFENFIIELNGIKIPESKEKTPDFLINNVVLELKDLQQESLLNTERQQSISKIFEDYNDQVINLDPSRHYEGYSSQYHSLIETAIHKHFKKASSQIKTYKKSNTIENAGIIMLNTGMFSLPHELFKSMIENILRHKTKTIEFAFILSQKTQGNGFDQYVVASFELIGNAPKEVLVIKDNIQKALNKVLDKRMTDAILRIDIGSSITPQHPISFLSGNKIFYWNPGEVPDSRK